MAEYFVRVCCWKWCQVLSLLVGVMVCSLEQLWSIYMEWLVRLKDCVIIELHLEVGNQVGSVVCSQLAFGHPIRKVWFSEEVGMKWKKIAVDFIGDVAELNGKCWMRSEMEAFATVGVGALWCSHGWRLLLFLVTSSHSQLDRYCTAFRCFCRPLGSLVLLKILTNIQLKVGWHYYGRIRKNCTRHWLS